MTLIEMSEKVYQADLEQINARILELKAAEKMETDKRTVEGIRRRLVEMGVIARQTKELMDLTRVYYAPGCHRRRSYEKYRFY